MNRSIAFLLSLIPLALLLWFHNSLLGTIINLNWLPSFGVNFHLGVDALSLLFLYLTAVIVPVSILSMKQQPSAFYGLILALQWLMIGFFTARDLFLFTLFWEAVLLPLYFIIGYWGGVRRKNASLKFLLYMIGGSVLMIAAVLALYVTKGTFDLDKLANVSTPWICAIFLLAFAVKTPLFPFHAWLPDTYCEAPVAGTILLSALLSKAGIYGILRVVQPLFPALMKAWNPGLLGLAIAGVFYGGLAAWRQNDFKRLIAYSSLSHVNFILAGLFVWSQTASSGAILQSLNHGVTIAALFLVAGWLEERLGTTHIESGGLTPYMPQLAWLTLFFVLASVAVPGTNNFVGELLILFGLFTKNPWAAAFLTLSIILSVLYMLGFMRRVYFGPSHPHHKSWTDINGNEKILALTLAALILWVGIYPAPLLKLTQAAAEKIGFA